MRFCDRSRQCSALLHLYGNHIKWTMKQTRYKIFFYFFFWWKMNKKLLLKTMVTGRYGLTDLWQTKAYRNNKVILKFYNWYDTGRPTQKNKQKQIITKHIYKFNKINTLHLQKKPQQSLSYCVFKWDTKTITVVAVNVTSLIPLQLGHLVIAWIEYSCNSDEPDSALTSSPQIIENTISFPPINLGSWAGNVMENTACR